MRKLKVAIVGFQHGHAFDMLNAIQARPDLIITGICEESERTREEIGKTGEIVLTHKSFSEMLYEVECDIIVIGDTYDKHGPLAVQALAAGKHVLVDKPLCTKLELQTQMEELTAERNLCIGCLLSLREKGSFLTLKRIIEMGEIGRLVTISIFGRHPLSFGKRPEWYFIPGVQGGTLVDIGIHAVDMVHWLTDEMEFEVLAAREWNAKAKMYPHFNDAAQFMLKTHGGVGVLGDVSYLAPDKIGYSMDDYWMVVCHGTKGTARASCNCNCVEFVTDAMDEIQYRTRESNSPGIWLENFLQDIVGAPARGGINTAGILAASRNALKMKFRSKNG